MRLIDTVFSLWLAASTWWPYSQAMATIIEGGICTSLVVVVDGVGVLGSNLMGGGVDVIG